MTSDATRLQARAARGFSSAAASKASQLLTSVTASKASLLLKFRDGPGSGRFRGNGKAYFIAGVQILQRLAFLDLELFSRAAGVGADGAALGLLNGDGLVKTVNSRDRSGKRLLGPTRRTLDDEGRNTGRKGRCDLHGSLPVRYSDKLQ
jgi:hypothetical protein